MELPEIEQLVGEVENRVERLRSLYDQYFMGIERIEPQIARKDVERRIQILRKTQIRNTALRFRFQNALLRYNTFGAHWMRICRQIEEGTYKHHLRKAKERFDPANVAARDAQKQGSLELGDTEPPPGPPVFDLGEDLDVDVDFDEGMDGPDMRAALRSYAIPQEVMAHSVAGRALQAMTGPTAAPAPRAEQRRGPPGPDAGLDRNTDPAPPLFPSIAPSGASVAPAAAKVAPPGARSVAPPLPTRGTAPASPSRAPPPLPPGAQQASTGRTMPPPLPNRPPGGIPAANVRVAPPPTNAAAVAAPAARPAPVAAATVKPAPIAAGARPTPAPAAPNARPAPSPAEAPAPTARPAPTLGPTRPPATAATAAAAAATPSRPAAQARPTSAADEQDRQIYSKYVESRRSLGESTAAITLDGVAKSLRDSREKLRQKHPGKNVDFEVQVKDGKTVLKPIVK